MAPQRREKRGLNLETSVTVQIRRLRGRTVKTETSPSSVQLSTGTISGPTIDGNPGDNTRRLRSRIVKSETSPCSGQLSAPVSSEPIIDGNPGDNTRRLRSRIVKTEISPCSGQLSAPASSKPIIDGYPDDSTRRLHSRTVNTEISQCSGQLSAPASFEPTIDRNPGDNIRRLRSRTIRTEISPCSGQLSTPASSEPTNGGNAGDNTRRLRSRTVKTEISPCSGQLSTVTISEPTIDENPGDNTRRLLSRTMKTETAPCSGQISTLTISELTMDGNPDDNTRRLRIKKCPGQVSTSTSSELTIDGNPGDNVKLTSDGLPGDWIKEVKPRKKDSSRNDVFYIEPKTGYAFRSLKDALRYVETSDVLSCTLRPLKRSMEEIRILSSQMIKTESTVSPTQPSNLIEDRNCGDIVCKFVQENQLTPHGLPKSWIKELKPRNNGSNMVDQFYVEPDTGYAFWSVKDALRYVATGSIRSCRVRPKRRSIEEVRALINSPEIPSISGMKTVQHESLPHVQENSLHRKRKRSSAKSPDLKPNEELKTPGTEGATRTASWREKQHRERPLCVRASPRLSALKAKIEADYDGIHEENNDLWKTVPTMLNSFAPPDLNRTTSSLPDTEPKEEAMVENGTSTRTPLRSGKIHRTRPMPLRTSSHLAASKATIDITTVESMDRMTSNDVLKLTPSSHLYVNKQPSSNPNLLEQEEIVEGVNCSSTGTPLQSRKMPKPTFRAASRLAAPKLTTDAATVINENSMTSIVLFEPSPSSLSYPNMRTISKPDLEFKEETTEGTYGSSIGTTLRQKLLRREMRKMRKIERRPTLRASSHYVAQKVTSNTAAVENGSSMMSDALFEPASSLSSQNQKSSSHPDLELEETIEGTKGSPSKILLSGGKMCGEKLMTVRATSCLATADATIDASSVKNENSWWNNASCEPPSSSLSFPTRNPRQPNREIKEERRQGADGSSTGTMDRPSGENKDNSGTNADSEPSHSHASLSFPTRKPSQPNPELKEERRQGADGSSNGTMDRPSDENKDNSGTNADSEPPHSHPDLNLGPTGQPDWEFKEVLGGANGRGSRTILQREKLCRETPATMRASSHLSALKSTIGPTCDANHEENKKKSNAFSEVLLRPARPDLNFGPTSQPYWESKEETIVAANGSETETISCQEMPSSVKVTPWIKTLKMTTEATSSKNCQKNSTITHPHREPKVETIAVANGSNSGTISCREMPTSVKVSHCLKPLTVTTGATSSKSYEKNNMTSQPHRESKVEKIAAANGSETGAISRRWQSCRERAAPVKISPCLKALKVTTEVPSSRSGENNNINNAFSEPSHFPGRSDLDFGPASYLNFAPRQQMVQANGYATGTTLSRMELHCTGSTPGKAIEGSFHDSFGKNVERSNYLCGPVENPASQIITGPTNGKNTERNNIFCGPVEYPASQIITEPAYGKDTERSNYFCGPAEYPASQINMGPTYQPNSEEFWLNTATAAPSSMVAEVKGAPDLNMVPMSWPEPGVERVLESYPGPKLKQQQPASINTIGELRLQPPASSEIPYQDPTMDVLLGGQEPSPSMPHMSIDALNSPMSSFFGDFWHDPCLSYAFSTLTGGMRQQQVDPGLSPGNNYRAGAQNGGPIENVSTRQTESTSRNPQYRNNGVLYPK